MQRSRLETTCLLWMTMAVLLLAVAGCGAVGAVSSATATPAPTPTPTPLPFDLVVLHTNDVMGIMQPCGDPPFKGGLARRTGVIKTTRGQFPNVLLLDAGNALWNALAEPTQGQVMVAGLNLMGYDALLLGDLDLQLGPEVLTQRIAEATFPVLSANVLLASDNTLLAQPYAVLKLGDRKVGIIGLTSELGQQGPNGDKYVLLKAEDALRKVVAEVALQTDIIIVLSNLGYDEDQRLSSLVPGIDLIVGGRSGLSLPDGWRNEQNGAIVVQAGEQGQQLGRCQLRLDGSATVASHSCEVLLLTEDYPDDADMRAFLDISPVECH